MCSTVDIPVPSQTTLHKQWCLFDQEKNIDFDRQVWGTDTKSVFKVCKLNQYNLQYKRVLTALRADARYAPMRICLFLFNSLWEKSAKILVWKNSAH